MKTLMIAVFSTLTLASIGSAQSVTKHAPTGRVVPMVQSSTTCAAPRMPGAIRAMRAAKPNAALAGSRGTSKTVVTGRGAYRL